MAIKPDHDERGTGRGEEPSLERSGTLGFLSGIAVGAAAGLIGVLAGAALLPLVDKHALKVLRVFRGPPYYIDVR